MDWKKIAHDVVVTVIGAAVVAVLGWVGVQALGFVPGVADYLDRDVLVPLWVLAFMGCLAFVGLWGASLSVWKRFRRTRSVDLGVVASGGGVVQEPELEAELAELDLEILRTLRVGDDIHLFLGEVAGGLRDRYPRSDIGFSLGELVAAGYVQEEVQANYECAYTLTAKGAGLARERGWSVGSADALKSLRAQRRLL